MHLACTIREGRLPCLAIISMLFGHIFKKCHLGCRNHGDFPIGRPHCFPKVIIQWSAIALTVMALPFAIENGIRFFPPRCLIKALTGFDCPGCGTTRAFLAVIQGNFQAAFRYNPFLIIVLPFVILMAVRPDIAKKWPVIICGFILTTLWTVFRNFA